MISGTYGPNERSGIWILPVTGGPPRKLYGNAAAGAVLSPDNTKIAFRRGRGVWVAEVAGGQPRRLFDFRGYSALESMAWSADGRRIIFGKRSNEEEKVTIEARHLDTGRAGAILSDTKIDSFCWAADGRLIYTRREAPPNGDDSNLWELRVNPRSAEVKGAPRRLSNWSGFLLDFPSIARTGRLFAIGNRWRSDVRLMHLAGDRHTARLTTEWFNRPTGWTHDSKAVLFDSNRNGEHSVFQQRVDTREAQALPSSPDHILMTRTTPDGRWILYLAWPKDGQKVRRGEGRLMLVPASGGRPEKVMSVSGFPSIETPHPQFRCPSLPRSQCVLSELVEGRIVFTGFDVPGGRSSEVARIEDESPIFWDLSPDGRSIAAGKWGGASIRLIPLAGQQPREFRVDGLTGLLRSVAWAADGKALFATAFSSFGEPLLRISLDGRSELLYRGSKYVNSPVVSPDGRYLAFADQTVESNAWVIDNLR